MSDLLQCKSDGQSCLPKPLTPKPGIQNLAIITPPLKNAKIGGEPWTPPPRGDPEVNNSIFPAWKLQPGENYVNVFCRNVDRSQLPKLTICLNYHVRGSCHSLCDRVTSHCPVQTLDEPTKKSVSTYIAAIRLQYKNKNPS